MLVYSVYKDLLEVSKKMTLMPPKIGQECDQITYKSECNNGK